MKICQRQVGTQQRDVMSGLQETWRDQLYLRLSIELSRYSIRLGLRPLHQSVVSRKDGGRRAANCGSVEK